MRFVCVTNAGCVVSSTTTARQTSGEAPAWPRPTAAAVRLSILFSPSRAFQVALGKAAHLTSPTLRANGAGSFLDPLKSSSGLLNSLLDRPIAGGIGEAEVTS